MWQAWFAHRGDDGAITHVEIRGPHLKGSLEGGTKTLFRLPGAGAQHLRLVITEAPIDALSVAAIENISAETLYAATGGGMGPVTVQAIERVLARMAQVPCALPAGATDANPARRALCRAPRRARCCGRYRLRTAGAAGGLRLERCPSDGQAIMNWDRAWVMLPSGRRLDLLNPDPWAWTSSRAPGRKLPSYG